MRPTTKALVLVISLGLLAGGIYATLHLDQEFDRSLLAKEDSYYKAFMKIDHEYFQTSHTGECCFRWKCAVQEVVYTE